MTNEEKARAIGGGTRHFYEDASIRSWACGCYEDQHGYHFCSTHQAHVSIHPPPQTFGAENAARPSDVRRWAKALSSASIAAGESDSAPAVSAAPPPSALTPFLYAGDGLWVRGIEALKDQPVYLAADVDARLDRLTRDRDEYKALASVGAWHKDCRPNRRKAAEEIQKSQQRIDTLRAEVARLTRELKEKKMTEDTR